MMSRAPQASRQRAQPLDIFRSEGYGSLPGLFLAGYRPFEAVSVRARLNNRGPVSNPIQERLAQPGVGKDLCPFREWQIGGNDQGRSLGSFADDLKHQLRADLSEGDIAVFEPPLRTLQLSDGRRRRQRRSTLSASEVMTIVILFQASGFRNFKTYYTQYVCEHPRGEFPNLVSYQRLVELQREVILPLAAFLRFRFGPCTGISFIDSTPIKVCHNLRIKSNQVFRELAKRGKTSTGWFYGFKVHLIIIDCGDLLAVMITPGNVDDRKPAPRLARRLFGKLFGDRGYISKELFALLSRARRATDHQD